MFSSKRRRNEEGFVEGVAGFSGGLWSINYSNRWDLDWPPFAVAVFGKDTNNIVYSDAFFQGTAKNKETAMYHTEDVSNDTLVML